MTAHGRRLAVLVGAVVGFLAAVVGGGILSLWVFAGLVRWALSW